MTDRLAASLEGYLSTIYCHYGPHKWVSSFNCLDWEDPAVFTNKPLCHAYNVFTDGGREGAVTVVFLPDHVCKTYFKPCQGLAQNKEVFAVVLALAKVKEPFNLFSDSLYVVNLLPGLAQAYIRLDNNPITPLMIQARSLLRGRAHPLYVTHLRGHQNISSFLSQGNSTADQLASQKVLISSLQAAQELHDHTLVNWRDLHNQFPHVPIKDLKTIIHTCKSCRPFIQVAPLG